jgi:hypothetical protein
MEIDESDDWPANADPPISASLEGDSKMTVARLIQA